MKNRLTVRAGWLIDGTGGPVRTDVLVHIEDGRIESIGEPRESAPTASEMLDLSSCTLIPGLVDCHVHMAMSGTEDREVRQKQLALTYEEAFPVISAHLENHLSFGVLAVRDGGDPAAHTLRFKKDPQRPQSPVLLKAAGRGFHAHGRYGGIIGGCPHEGQTLAQSIESLEEKPDHVKIVNSGLNSLIHFGRETPPQFSLEELRDAVRTCTSHGLKTMVHANGTIAVQLAVDAGCDSIEHGFFMGLENLSMMADRQVYWVPTAYTMKAYCEQLSSGSPEAETAARNFDHQVEQLAQARRLGVPVAVGTDSGGLGINHGKSFANEVIILFQAGYSVEEAVRCASSHGARLLGIEGGLGELRPGMPATFAALRGAPMNLPEILGSPAGVYISGVRMPETDGTNRRGD